MYFYATVRQIARICVLNFQRSTNHDAILTVSLPGNIIPFPDLLIPLRGPKIVPKITVSISNTKDLITIINTTSTAIGPSNTTTSTNHFRTPMFQGWVIPTKVTTTRMATAVGSALLVRRGRRRRRHSQRWKWNNYRCSSKVPQVETIPQTRRTEAQGINQSYHFLTQWPTEWLWLTSTCCKKQIGFGQLCSINPNQVQSCLCFVLTYVFGVRRCMKL